MNPLETLLASQKELLAVVTKNTATLQTFIQAQAEKRALRNSKFTLARDLNSVLNSFIDGANNVTPINLSEKVNLNDFSQIMVEITLPEIDISNVIGIALVNEGLFGLSLYQLNFGGEETFLFQNVESAEMMVKAGDLPPLYLLREQSLTITRKFTGPFGICRFGIVSILGGDTMHGSPPYFQNLLMKSALVTAQP